MVLEGNGDRRGGWERAILGLRGVRGWALPRRHRGSVVDWVQSGRRRWPDDVVACRLIARVVGQERFEARETNIRIRAQSPVYHLDEILAHDASSRRTERECRRTLRTYDGNSKQDRKSN